MTTKHIITFQHIMEQEEAYNEITTEHATSWAAEREIRLHKKMHETYEARDLKECHVVWADVMPREEGESDG